MDTWVVSVFYKCYNGCLCKVFVWTYFFNFLGDIPRSEIAGTHGNELFEKLPDCFCSGCIILYSQKQSMRVSSLFLKKSYIWIVSLNLFCLSNFSFYFTKHTSSLHLWLLYPTFVKVTSTFAYNTFLHTANHLWFPFPISSTIYLSYAEHKVSFNSCVQAVHNYQKHFQSWSNIDKNPDFIYLPFLFNLICLIQFKNFGLKTCIITLGVGDAQWRKWPFTSKEVSQCVPHHWM